MESQEDCFQSQVSKLSEKELGQLKQRQRIQAASKELQELEYKLRTAYMYKELEAQIEERKLIKLQEKIQDQFSQEIIDSIVKDGELMEAEKVKEHSKKREEYRRALDYQIHFNALRREDAYQQFLREKRIIDEIAQALHEEELIIQEAKLKQRKLAKESIDNFLKARDVWKMREEEAMKEEDRRISKYLAEKQNFEEKRQKDIKAKVEKQAKLQEIAAKIIEESKGDDEERTEIIAELVQEEKRKALEERHRLEIERKIRQRLDFVNTLNSQRQDEEARKKMEKENDKLFAQQMMEKLEEEDKLAQLSNEKRRQKQMEHRKAIQALINLKAQKREEERKHLEFLDQLEIEREQERCRIIEEERRRLLQEHAVKLIGHLPRGLLREDDFSYLGEEFRKEFFKASSSC